jgi:dihydrofolate synthase/folylpolyglutamate synthase
MTDLGRKGSKAFLEQYYSTLGNPHKKLKVIHITGTSGKGSTSSMIAKGLTDAGFVVGLFTSPHLLQINERIQINGSHIPDSEFNRLLEKYYLLFPNASFSEYLMLVSVDYFLEQNVDYVVYEVFVGGRYDPTNIFDSLATVITSIGLDHQNILGHTIDEILFDKLGILRKDIPVFTRLNNAIIDQEITNVGAKYIKVERLENTCLVGQFQKENAGIAFEVLSYLGLSSDSIRNSLKNTFWPGRLQYLARNVLVDCAHNPLGMNALRTYIDSLEIKNVYYLFALSRDKKYEDYEPFMSNAREIVFTKPGMFKIQDPKNYIKSGKIIENVIDAFSYLKSKLTKDDLLVVCGSIFLVSEILEYYTFED